MKISAHSIVKNEENFLWYSVMSVIDYVDEFLIWDTGSNDKTIKIIRLLKKSFPKKINYKLLTESESKDYSNVRQRMLESTNAEWIILVDADEIWWQSGIEKLTHTIKHEGNKLDSVVSSYVNCIGDIYHFQSEKYGKYHIDHHIGHITIRAFRNSDGMHFSLPHGQQGLFNKDNVLIQNMDPNRRIHLTQSKSYLHVTHLKRSSMDENVKKRAKKYKKSRGNSFSLDYYYPESFFFTRPDFVPTVWVKRDTRYTVQSYFFDIAREIKSLFPLPEKSGY